MGVMEKLQTIRFDKPTRIVITAIFFIVALMVMVLGVVAFNINMQEAQEIKKQMEDEFNQFNDLRFIFGNNLIHTLIMFVPIIGPIWGTFVLFNTGTIIAALSVADGVPPIMYLMVLFFTPFFWLEFGVYSIAMAQSTIWLLQLLRHRGKKEAVRTCILVTICTSILLLSAIVEWFMIKSLKG